MLRKSRSKEVDITFQQQFCCSVAKSCPALCDPLTTACQASLFFTISQSLLELKPTQLVRLYNCLILCRPFSSCPQSFPGPGSSQVDQTVKNLPVMQKTWVRSLGQEDPWRRKCQPTPVLLSGEFHGQRGLGGYSPWWQRVRHD